mgnify:CR=1 FL=1
MSGLDKIIESILDSAKQEADVILHEADKKAEEILNAGQKEIEMARKEAAENIEKETQKLRQMAEAADKQNKRQALLRVRIEMIGQFISAAKEKILAMPDKEYFDLLYQVFVNQNIQADGEILFSEKDKKRMPKDFTSRLNSASDGGKITLSQETAGIENGFIVRCGKIEINCTIDSILEEKDSELRDRLNQYLSEEQAG